MGDFAFERSDYVRLLSNEENKNRMTDLDFFYNPNLIPKDVKTVRLLVRAYRVIDGYQTNQSVIAWIEHDLPKE